MFDVKELPADLQAFVANCRRFGVTLWSEDDPAQVQAQYARFKHCLKDLPCMGAMTPPFVQRNPKFAEGSMPLAGTPEWEYTDRLLHFLGGLDPRTTFKMGVDGMVVQGGGLLWIIPELHHSFLLAVKGDPYTNGKVGVLGGQAMDADRGDTQRIVLREFVDEANQKYTGKLPFKFFNNAGYRDTDSRGEWGLSTDFFIRQATHAETDQVIERFKVKGPNHEVRELRVFSAASVLELMGRGAMAYPEQMEAMLLAVLCIHWLEDGRKLAEDYHPQNEVAPWDFAKAIVRERFEHLTAGDKWWLRISPEVAAF